MAKKEKFDLDDYNFGSEFDVPDFNFDMAPPKDDRKAITKVSHGAIKGFKDQLTSPESVRKLVVKSLPKGYGSALDLADQATGTIKSLYDTTAKEMKPMLNDMKRSTQKILPTIEKGMPQALTKRLRKWAETTEDKAGHAAQSESDRREAEINAQVANVFAANADQDQKDRAVDKADERIRDGINHARHGQSLDAMGGIGTGVMRLNAFNDKYNAPFLRKSLELQFRSYFLAMDAFGEQKKQNAVTTKELEEIKKNTGLPDYVKLQSKEYLAQVMRNKFIDNVGDTLFGKRRDFIRNIGKKIVSRGAEKVGNITSGVRSAMGSVDSLAELAEMQKEFGGPGAAELGGNILGAAGADSLIDRAGKHLNKHLRKNDNVVKRGNKLQYFTENLPQIAGTAANGYAGDDLPIIGGLVRFLKDLTKDELRGPSQALQSDSLANLQNPDVFGRRTNKSITEVIPGYLARILREVTSLRTGANAELVEYDYTNNKFDNTSTVKKNIFGTIVTDRDKQGVNYDMDRLFKGIDPEGKLTDQQRRTLGRQLVKDNLSNKEGDPERYKSSGGFDKASAHDAELFAQIFKDLFKDDHLGDKKLAFSREFSRLGDNFADRRGQVQEHINAGSLQHLVELGIVDEKGQAVNIDKLFDYYLPPEVAAQASEAAHEMGAGGVKGASRRVSRTRGSMRGLPAAAPSTGTTLRHVTQHTAEPSHAPAPVTTASPMNPGFGELKEVIKEASSKTEAEKTNEILTRLEEQLKAGITLHGRFGKHVKEGDDPHVPFSQRSLSSLGKSAWGGIKNFGHFASTQARTGASLAGAGFHTAKEVGKKGWGWLTNKAEEINDVYIKGELDPRLLKAKMQAGLYRDQATGKVIQTYNDIKGTVIDEDGNIVLDAAKGEIKRMFVKLPGGEKLLSALGVGLGKIKDLTLMGLGALPGLYGTGFQVLKMGYDKLLNGPVDVYVVGNTDPVLLAVTMQAGGYASRLTSKPIHSPKDIDGPVYDAEGKIVLSAEDLAKGLLDVHGRPLKTGWQKGLQMGKDAALWGINKLKKYGEWVKDKASAAWEGVKNIFRGAGGVSLEFQVGRSARNSTRLLLDIRDMLNDRLPGKRTKFADFPMNDPDLKPRFASIKKKLATTKDWFDTKKNQTAALFDKYFGKKAVVGDDDGDGIRDGSYKDQLKKKAVAAKDALAAGGSAIAGGASSAYGGLKKGAGSLWDRLRGKKKKGDGEDDDSGGGGTNIDINTGGGKAAGGLVKEGAKDLEKVEQKIPKGFWGKVGHYGLKGAKTLGKGAWSVAKFLGPLALGLMGLEGAGAVAAGVGTAALGIGGAVLGGLGAAAAGVLSVLASPIVLGGLAVAAVGYGAYKAYKWATAKKLDKYNTPRYAQYGFLATEDKYLNQVMGLEDIILPGVIVSEGKAKLDTKKIDWDKAVESFGISKKDKEAVGNWLQWFMARFKPVFLTHIQVIQALAPGKGLNDLSSLKPDQLKAYVKGVQMPDGPYSQATSPFPDQKSLSAGPYEAKAAFDALNAEIEKMPAAGPDDAPKTPGAALAAGATAAAGAAGASTVAGSTGNGSSGATPAVPTVPGSALSSLVKQTQSKVGDDSNGQGVVTVSADELLASAFGSDSIDPITAIRFKTYGLNEMAADKVRALYQLEAYIGKDLKFKNTTASWTGAIDKAILAMGPSFGVEGVANTNAYNWITWFNIRFLPTFLNYATAAATATGKKNLTQAAVGIKPQQAVNIANVIYTTNGSYNDTSMSVWQIPVSPWPGYTLNSDVKSTEPNMAGLRQQAKQEVLQEEGAKDAKTTDTGGNPASQTGGPTTTIGKFLNKVSNGVVGAAKSVSTAVSNVWEGAKDAVGMGSGREIEQPGKGTGGDINSIPKPTGNGSWAALKDTIMAAAKMVGVDPQLLASVAAIESSFNYTAKAPNTSASGLFQFISGTWSDMIKKYGAKYGISADTPPTDPRASALLGAEYLKSNVAALGGPSAKLTDADLYLAHLLGPGGAKKFLAADPSAIGAQVMPDAAQKNGNLFYRAGKPLTVAEIHQNIANLVSSKAKQFGYASAGSEKVVSGTPAAPGAASPDAGPSGKSVTNSPGGAKAGVPVIPSAGGPAAPSGATTSNPIGKFPVADQAAIPSAANSGTAPSADAPMQVVSVVGKRPAKDTPAPDANPMVGLSPQAQNVQTIQKYQSDQMPAFMKDVGGTLSESLTVQKTMAELLKSVDASLKVMTSKGGQLTAPVTPTNPSQQRSNQRPTSSPSAPVPMSKDGAMNDSSWRAAGV